MFGLIKKSAEINGGGLNAGERKMTVKEKNLISMIANAVINAYDENGNTVEEYYNNIILPDLSPSDYETLKRFSEYNV